MEDIKRCTKCNRELLLDQFGERKYKNGNIGYKSRCKDCIKLENALWRENNPDYNTKWHKNNPEKVRAIDARWRKNNPETTRKKRARWKINNSDKHRTAMSKYRKKRRMRDPEYRLALNIRCSMARALLGTAKTAKTRILLGCSIEYLRHHLENQFIEGMTWGNYGVHGWHIDHIIPLSYFDFTDPEQQKRVWHYTNLQPLWAAENVRKSNKIGERQLLLL